MPAIQEHGSKRFVGPCEVHQVNRFDMSQNLAVTSAQLTYKLCYAALPPRIPPCRRAGSRASRPYTSLEDTGEAEPDRRQEAIWAQGF